jgi:predicted phosphodiesterase
VLVVHGGLEKSDEVVEADARPFFPPGISVVAAGHLHAPFIIRTRVGVWVNAGSTGRPCDGDPRAALAVLEQQPKGWKASIHRVPFDLEAAAQAIRKANMPYAERLVETQIMACWW